MLLNDILSTYFCKIGLWFSRPMPIGSMGEGIAREIDREIINELLKPLDETLPDLTLTEDDWDEYAGFHYGGDF